MLEGKKAVIFDLDGTLVDSMWMWKEIDVEFLGPRGFSLPPTLQKEIEGMSFSETAVYFKETFQLPESLEEIKACWIEMAMEKYSSQVPMKPGAEAFLKYLKEQGIRTGIATSNGRALAEAVIHANGMDAYIDTITTGCEVAKGKPAPDIYLKVAEDLDTAPSACLVFEDVPMGIRAGLSAGMEVCAVKDDFSKNQEAEIKRLAHYRIGDFAEVLKGTYEVLAHEA